MKQLLGPHVAISLHCLSEIHIMPAIIYIDVKFVLNYHKIMS
jgi:hypothetical protein